MLDRLYKTLDLYHLGDIASVLGLIVSIVGFIITIWGVWRSKTAAQRAEESSRRTHEAMTAMQSIVDISAVLAALEEIKRLHRASEWQLLLVRYGSLRAKLVALKASRPKLKETQHAVLQGTIQHLANLEVMVDRVSRGVKNTT